MARKTIILREDQFNEICGTNTAYLDNPGDYTEDGTLHMRTDGAVSDSYGGRENYSEPPTTRDIAHMMAPETLFALLFRNGGHGLWGHWGSGLRADVLDGFDKEFDNNPEDEEYVLDLDDEEDVDTRQKYFSDEDLEYLFESNSELEGSSWKFDLDNTGREKTYSYTAMTSRKTRLKDELNNLVRQGAPKRQVQKVKSELAGVCSRLDNATNSIRTRKENRKNLGFENQFQKAGGTKDSGNGKAHTKKTKDPNVGTGYITYA